MTISALSRRALLQGAATAAIAPLLRGQSRGGRRVLALVGDRYHNADYIRVAAPLSGSLARLSVSRGDEVAANAPLFALESAQEAAARAEAEARMRQSEATLADLEKARRPPEIDAVRAQLAQAETALR